MRKQYDSLDLTKIILCCFVVAIHTLGKFGPYPILRIAVPIFFMISSYLFFRKWEGDNKVLHSFVKRNLKLYLFWFIALLPITIWSWIRGDMFKTLTWVIELPVRYLFGSTFPASWYLMALIIGVCLVCLTYQRGGKYFMIFCAVVSYILCCLFSNYRNLLAENSILTKLLYLYPGTIYNSFPAGLIWIVAGKTFADYENRTTKNKVKFNTWCALFVSFLLLLMLEHQVVAYLLSSVDNDCYFMLLPVCISLFGVILNADIKCSHAKKMRNISTIIYCLHGSVATVMKVIFEQTKIADVNLLSGALLLFFSTLFLSGVVACLLLKLEKLAGFKWIKASH